MRDAFGGSFMIRIFLIFILIYILLTAVVLNYAKAYRAKDLVVSYLEDNEIDDIGSMSADDLTKMEEYFESVLVGTLGYVTPLSPTDCKSEDGEEVFCFEPGIKIRRIDKPTSSNKLGVYYQVTTYYRYDIGFLRAIKAADNSDVDKTSDIGKWEISGETRPIVRE